jgi:hypothetical protein
MHDQKLALLKSLTKFLSTIQSEYNARGKDQVQGIEEWSSKTYGFDFEALKASKKKPKSKKAVKDKLVKDQKAVNETVKG